MEIHYITKYIYMYTVYCFLLVKFVYEAQINKQGVYNLCQWIKIILQSHVSLIYCRAISKPFLHVLFD